MFTSKTAILIPKTPIQHTTEQTKHVFHYKYHSSFNHQSFSRSSVSQPVNKVHVFPQSNNIIPHIIPDNPTKLIAFQPIVLHIFIPHCSRNSKVSNAENEEPTLLVVFCCQEEGGGGGEPLYIQKRQKLYDDNNVSGSKWSELRFEVPLLPAFCDNNEERTRLCLLVYCLHPSVGGLVFFYFLLHRHKRLCAT